MGNYHQSGIVAAKTKGVRDSCAHYGVSTNTGHNIQGAGGISHTIVDSGGYEASVYRQSAGYRLDSPGGT